jgi:hypothetical protein
MSRQIKTIGIVGGLGPESTIEYYRQIIARYREQISDGSYPPIIIHSMDVRELFRQCGANEFRDSCSQRSRTRVVGRARPETFSQRCLLSFVHPKRNYDSRRQT